MPPRQSPTAQDKPFTFKARAGVITIPSSEVYDPSMDAIAEMYAAVKAYEALDGGASIDETGLAQMRISLASLDVLRSGFSEKVAEKIKLSASEVQTFQEAYQKHTGVSIPK